MYICHIYNNTYGITETTGCMRIFFLFIVQVFAATISAQIVGTGHVITKDGQRLSDVAIVLKDRPTYISNIDGNFTFALSNGYYTIERIEKAGYKLISPNLPYSSRYDGTQVKIVMEANNDEQQRVLYTYGEKLFQQALYLEQKQLYGDAADSLVKRAALDTLNVRWQYETGEYMHKYGDYLTAQTYYNKAIYKAKELYGENNQYLAICYELYGDNYFDWKAWGDKIDLNFADAKAYYQLSGHAWNLLFDEFNNNSARINLKMGRCWVRLDNPLSAKKCWDMSLSTLQNTPDADRNLLASVYLKMIEYFYSIGNYSETMSFLQKLLALEKEMYGENSESYQTVLKQIELLKKEQ